MPNTPIHFYQESPEESQVAAWLQDLKNTNPRAFAKLTICIQELAKCGHELRRPYCDFLRDGIYELRAKLGRVNYRLLYFFNGREVAVIATGLTKEATVPNVDIDQAIIKKAKFAKNPSAHIWASKVQE